MDNDIISGDTGSLFEDTDEEEIKAAIALSLHPMESDDDEPQDETRPQEEDQHHNEDRQPTNNINAAQHDPDEHNVMANKDTMNSLEERNDVAAATMASLASKWHADRGLGDAASTGPGLSNKKSDRWTAREGINRAFLDERNDIALAIAASLASKREEAQQQRKTANSNQWTQSNESTHHRIYEEVPLQDPYKQTRFLRLRLDASGQIVSATLFSGFIEKVKYRALSYRWDTKGSLSPLVINGLDFPISTSLLNSFGKICPSLAEKGEVTMWIDAICINQEDNKEKSIQVSIMNLIYSLTSGVVIWLGMGNDETDETLRLIERASIEISFASGPPKTHDWQLIENLIGKLGLSREKLINGCNDLLTRPWWKRIWIVQEFVLPKLDPTIMCGTYAVAWQPFYKLMGNLKCHLTGPFRKYGELGLGEGVPENITAFYETTRINSLEVLSSLRSVFQCQAEHKESDHGLPLRHLLNATRESESFDPRDKIYGILGMAEGTARASIVVDYSHKTHREVFLEVMRHLIQREHSLGNLCRAPGVYYRDNVEEDPEYRDWPTWLPTFDEKSIKFRLSNPVLIPEHVGRTVVYDASKGLPPYCILVSDPQQPVLTVFGIPIGEVVEAVPCIPRELDKWAKPRFDLMLACFFKACVQYISSKRTMYDPDPNQNKSKLRGKNDFGFLIKRKQPCINPCCPSHSSDSTSLCLNPNCPQCISVCFEQESSHFFDQWALQDSHATRTAYEPLTYEELLNVFYVSDQLPSSDCQIFAVFPSRPQFALAACGGHLGGGRVVVVTEPSSLSCLPEHRNSPTVHVPWRYCQREPWDDVTWRMIIGDFLSMTGIPTVKDGAFSPVNKCSTAEKAMLTLYTHVRWAEAIYPFDIRGGKNKFSQHSKVQSKRAFPLDEVYARPSKKVMMNFESEKSINHALDQKIPIEDNVLAGARLFVKQGMKDKFGVNDDYSPILDLSVRSWLRAMASFGVQYGILSNISESDEREDKSLDPTTRSWLTRIASLAIQSGAIEDPRTVEDELEAAMLSSWRGFYGSPEFLEFVEDLGKSRAEDEHTSRSEPGLGEILHQARLASLNSKHNEDQKGSPSSKTDQESPPDPYKSRDATDEQPNPLADNGFEPKSLKAVWGFLSSQKINEVEECVSRITNGRSPFRTDTGFIGFRPLTTKPGDLVVVAAGADAPLILRQHQDHYYLVGEAYVHGVMFGELFEHCPIFKKEGYRDCDAIFLQKFEIR